MPKHREDLLWSVLAFCLLLFAGLETCKAQARDTDVLDVARLAVHEAGLWSPGDHIAIAHVLTRRAQVMDCTVSQAARLYGRRAWRGGSRRPWWLRIGLHQEGPPSGWPGTMAWTFRRAQGWREVLVRVRSVLEGRQPSSCPGAEHWGSRGCAACARRMRATGLEPMGCGLRNRYWGRRMVD